MEKLQNNPGMLNNMPGMLFGSFQITDEEQLYAIVEEAYRCGIKGFDTSPSYRSEAAVSRAINRYISAHNDVHREDFFFQTKIDEWQMIAKQGEIRPFVGATLKKIGQDYLDLLLIHWPQPDYFTATWKSMEKLYESGRVKAIGLCNVGERHVRLLEKAGANICPMVVQNEIHPLNTFEKSTQFLQDRGIVVQSYCPLCRMQPELTEKPLWKELTEKYGKSLAQIVLRWHIQRGLIPIVKTSKVKRVAENAEAMKFTLDAEDMERISGLNENFKIFLESRCCPGY